MKNNRRPLNEQTIVFYYDGVHTGRFGKGKYVSIISIRDACERENCPNEDEHLTFDGQIFFKKQVKP